MDLGNQSNLPGCEFQSSFSQPSQAFLLQSKKHQEFKCTERD